MELALRQFYFHSPPSFYSFVHKFSLSIAKEVYQIFTPDIPLNSIDHYLPEMKSDRFLAM
jgi:hypothetical protein